MTDEDVRKLLGGYATNTLSAEEQKALYEAALKDQKLFEELAGEQALRELMDDPQARTALLRAMQPRTARRWMAPLSIAASVLVIASLAFVFNRSKDRPVAESTGALVQTSPAAPEMPGDSRAKADPPAIARKPASPASTPQATPPASPALREEKANVSKDAAPMMAATQGTLTSPISAAITSGPVRYTVLKRAEDGSYRAVDSGSTFAPADSVKLNVETGEAGFLEVSLKNPPALLFGGQVEKQVPVIVPPTGDIPLASGHALRIQFSQSAFTSAAPMVKQKAAQEPAARNAAGQVAPRQPIIIEVDLKVAPQAKP